MSQMIEPDLRTPHEVSEHDHVPAGHGRGIPSVAIAIGALAVALALIVGVRAMTSSPAKAPTAAPFVDGSSVQVRCTGNACIAGTTDTQGAQWNWITTNGEAIPGAWLTSDVTGTVKVDSDWGEATFTSGGHSIVLMGGMATPEHSFFG
jgi:hypothetical protein